MYIEIERKLELSDYDYKIIKWKLKLKEAKRIEDIYMDNEEFYLFLNRVFCRKRNWSFELKDMRWNWLSNEYSWEEAIWKLKDYNIWYEELSELFTIVTDREKYIWILNWKEYIVDIDFHSLWKRYEIETTAETSIEWNKFIDGIIEDLWLKAEGSANWMTKWMLHIKKNLPDLYEMMMNNDFNYNNKV